MRYEDMDDYVDDTIMNPDFDPEAAVLNPGDIEEAAYLLEEDIEKSQPGPMDVHQSVGMFAPKKKKRKKIGKSFDEIYRGKR